MDRKAVAKQTVAIMERGFYEVDGEKIDIKGDMEESRRWFFERRKGTGGEHYRVKYVI